MCAPNFACKAPMIHKLLPSVLQLRQFSSGHHLVSQHLTKKKKKKIYTAHFIHHFRILHKEQLVLFPSQKFTCLAFLQQRESLLSMGNLDQKGTTYSRLPLCMKFLLLINNVNMVKDNGLVFAVLLINKETLI
jgi:hypothetical protein